MFVSDTIIYCKSTIERYPYYLSFIHFFAVWFEVVNDQVMNLKEEFKEAQGWVKESLNFDINKVIKIIFKQQNMHCHLLSR